MSLDINKIRIEYIEPHENLSCDKNHAHDSQCFVYDTPEIKVIHDMHDEIWRLRYKLERIATGSNWRNDD